MAEQLVIDLLIQDKSAMSIAQMRAEVKKLQSELANLDPNSAEFEAAAKRAGELRDNIEDASEAVNNMKGEPIESLKGNFEGLGTSVKNLDFEGATRKLNAMGSSLKNINFGSIIKQIGGMGKALLSLAATAGPILILAGAIAAIGYLLYKNYKDGEKAEEDFQAAQEYTNELMKDGGEIMKAHATSMENLTEQYRKSKQEVQLLNGEITDSDAKIADLKAESLTTFQEINSRHINANIKIQEGMKKELEAAKALFDKETQSDYLSKEKYEEIEQEFRQKIRDIRSKARLNELKEEEAFNKERLLLEEAFGNKVTAVIIKNNDKEKKAAADKWASMNKSADEYFKNLQEKYYGAYYTAITTYDEELKKYNEYLASKVWSQEQYDEAMMMLSISNKRDMDELEKIEEPDELVMPIYGTKKNLDDAIDYTLEQEKWLREQQDLIQQGWYVDQIFKREDNLGKQLDMLKDYYAQGLILEKDYNYAVYQVQMQRLDNYKAVSDTMGDISTSFFDFLGNLAEGNEKKQKKIQKAAFKVNKATSAVSTAINTSQAIMKIAAEIPPPFSFPLQILTGIQGAAQIAAILSKKFPEDGNADTGGGGTAPSTAGTTPSIANMYGGGGGTPTTFQSLSPANQPIQKVVVLESDISSAQQNVAKVGVQSTF